MDVDGNVLSVVLSWPPRPRNPLIQKVAERVGFEPTVSFHLRLISNQVPSTTQPPLLLTRLRAGLATSNNSLWQEKGRSRR
jgi:hypothetical protein